METSNVVTEVRKYCSEYLGDVWQQLSNEITVKRCKVGMANRSFICSLNVNGTTERVLVKLYGTDFYSDAENKELKCHCEASETVVFDRLSSKQLAAKLLGVFKGGRIEEFIHGRNMTLSDLLDMEMNISVVRKLAQFHSQHMPITKAQVFNKYLGEIISIEPKFVSHLSDSQRAIMKKVEDFQMKNEFLWCTRLVEKCNSRIVFSHNDFFLPNIMLKDHGDTLFDRVLIIDYEHSSYNNRGSDISQFLYANEFDLVAESTEISLNYIGNSVTETLKQKVAEAYLNEWKAIAEPGSEDCYDTVDHLVMEIEVHGLLVYINLIGFVNYVVYTSECSVGTLEYINDLIRLYNSLKESVVLKYPELLM